MIHENFDDAARRAADIGALAVLGQDLGDTIGGRNDLSLRLRLK